MEDLKVQLASSLETVHELNPVGLLSGSDGLTALPSSSAGSCKDRVYHSFSAHLATVLILGSIAAGCFESV